MVGRFPLSVIWHVKLWRQRSGINRLYEAAWLGRELKAQGVTHIHTHFAGIGARTAWWIRQFYGITYSFTGHANDMFCPNDDPISLSQLVTDASFVVTVSDFSKDWLAQQFPYISPKLHRVYNGMEISSGFEFRKKSDIPLILSVGRAIEKKGFADLIDACAELNRQGFAFRCQIIGGGPLESELHDQIQTLGLSANVELLGAMPLVAVRQKLQEAYLFALPCVAESDGGMDNLPTVILEAMDAGLPVVSTGLAAVPEMVNNGKTGFLVTENDVKALAVALTHLLSSPTLAEAMGQAGHALAKEKFSLPQTVSSLKALIDHSLQVSSEDFE
jgi:glycosyltransferase involved in cell wall biosynthesis